MFIRTNFNVAAILFFRTSQLAAEAFEPAYAGRVSGIPRRQSDHPRTSATRAMIPQLGCVSHL